jgi:hypothetical protein
MRGREQYEGPIALWGEWEPDSEVDPIIDPVPYGPNFVHRPRLKARDSYVGLQNTDPMVLGGFFYTCCQQHVRRGPSGMQRLGRAALILFGSALNGNFVLDTLIVTADEGIPHAPDDFRATLRGLVPAPYFHTTLEPWYAEGGQACRLYRGATHRSPIDEMFSFFPTAPFGSVPRGFRRPAIRIEGIISPSKTQGRKTVAVSPDRAREVWAKVVAQIVDRGQEELWLGVEAEMPKSTP